MFPTPGTVKCVRCTSFQRHHFPYDGHLIATGLEELKSNTKLDKAEFRCEVSTNCVQLCAYPAATNKIKMTVCTK